MRCGLRNLCSVPIVFLDFTKITAPCYFTLQLHCSSSRVGKKSSACSRLWCLLVADSQSQANYSWEYETEEIRDTLDKASFPACDFEAGMERAWEGIINVHKWHLKNAVLNYCKAVVVWRRKLWSAHLPFFGNTFHLWLSHVIVAWAAAARCLFSLLLPLLPPVLLQASSLGNTAMLSRETAASVAFTASRASAWTLQGLQMSLFTLNL